MVFDINNLRHVLFGAFQHIALIPKQPQNSSVEELFCEQSDIELRFGKHHLTAHNPVHILKPQGYFRECRKHEAFSKYILRATEEFVTEVIPVLNVSNFNNWGGHFIDYSKLVDVARNNKTLEKMRKMGNSSDVNSPLMQFHRNGNYYVLGLSAIKEVYPHEIIHNYVWYISSYIDAYNVSRYWMKNKWQTYFASRGIATYRLSELLGLQGYIPRTKYVNLEVKGGRNRFGSFMDVAYGVHYDDYSKLDAMHIITPTLQRSLTSLNLLDALTYEKDHRLNNYNVVLDEKGYATGVCAYDNDAPLTFFVSPSATFQTYAGCSPFVKDSKINRPYLDKRIAIKFLSLKDNDIRNCLKDYCNSLQIWAVCRRLKKIQNAIKVTMDSKNDFLIDNDTWSENTIKEELSNKYGRTYLSLINTIYQNKD